MSTRIMVIGPGLIGKKHIEIINNSVSAELVGIVTRTESLDSTKSRYPDVPVYDELFMAMERLRPDGVIIASPNEMHLRHLETCAKFNCPVLLEKPALLDFSEFMKFNEQFGGLYGQRKVLVGHHRVHSSQLMQAKSLIDSGSIGTINGFVGRAAFFKPDFYFNEKKWRKELPGGGPILINLIHEVQSMRLLIGEISQISGHKTSNFRGFDVEDTVSLSIRFESGALGTFFLSDTSVSPYSWELTSGENKSYPKHSDVSCYEIFGTSGTLTVPDLKLFSQKINDRSWWKEICQTKQFIVENDPLVAQFDHFLRVIVSGEMPLVDLNSGIRNVKIVDDLKRVLI